MLQWISSIDGYSVWINSRILKCAFYSQLMKDVKNQIHFL